MISIGNAQQSSDSTNNYFYITPIQDCYITVTDIQGRFVEKKKIVDKQNEIVFDTTNWQPGSYIISLFVGNSLHESQKLNLVK